VAAALNIYLIGMLFAAIDFPLNYAFYARNNTLLPALVGVLSVMVYVVVAFALIEGLGYLGLVWADSAKQISHAVVMLAMLGWRVGWLTGNREGSKSDGLIQGFSQILLAAGVMVATVTVISSLVSNRLPAGDGGDMLHLFCAGGGGLLIYGLVLYYIGLPEMRQLWVRVSHPIMRM